MPALGTESAEPRVTTGLEVLIRTNLGPDRVEEGVRIFRSHYRKVFLTGTKLLRGVAATLPYDFVISPTAPMTAFAAELPSPTNDPLKPFPHIGFTVAYNMSEQPAVSINAGYSAEGLPIGMQIVGRRFDDLGVLALARAFEEMRAGEARAWPEPPSH